MAWPAYLQNLSIALAAMFAKPGVEPGWLRNFPAAGLLAGLVALVLASGLAAAGISLALNASPLPVVNTAASVFLIASTVVSSHIVYAFWHHLQGEMLPVAVKPILEQRPRPPRPLRDI